jgi:hypothetical protein
MLAFAAKQERCCHNYLKVSSLCSNIGFILAGWPLFLRYKLDSLAVFLSG